MVGESVGLGSDPAEVQFALLRDAGGVDLTAAPDTLAIESIDELDSLALMDAYFFFEEHLNTMVIGPDTEPRTVGDIRALIRSASRRRNQ